MNAHALLKYVPWYDPKPEKKTLPPEAYDYDEPITKEQVAAIQEEADKVLSQKKWVVIERIGDAPKR